jgi:hypothetical protein
MLFYLLILDLTCKQWSTLQALLSESKTRADSINADHSFRKHVIYEMWLILLCRDVPKLLLKRKLCELHYPSSLLVRLHDSIVLCD